MSLELVFRAENRCRSSGAPARAFPKPPRAGLGREAAQNRRFPVLPPPNQKKTFDCIPRLACCLRRCARTFAPSPVLPHRPEAGASPILELGRSIGPCKKYGFLCFLTRARGGLGAPGRPPRALNGPARSLRRPPGGTRDLRQTKAKNLET